MDPLLDDLLEVLRLLQSMEGPKCFPIKYLLDFWDSWILLNIGWRPLHNSALQRRGAHLRRGHHHPAEGGRQLWQKPGHQVLIAQPWFQLENPFIAATCTHLSNEQCCLSFVSLIDREGRSLVKCSSYQACNEVNRRFKVHSVNNFMDALYYKLTTWPWTIEHHDINFLKRRHCELI